MSDAVKADAREAVVAGSLDEGNSAKEESLRRVGRAFEAGADFRIVTRESGSVRTDLPIFTALPGAIQLMPPASSSEVWREDFPEIPGAFLLHNVLSDAECDQMLAMSEAMGYTEDAPVSLGRHIRQNENCVWIAEPGMNDTLYQRCLPHLPADIAGGSPAGINMRWRLYKYSTHDIFRPHTDGSWPGSGIDTATGHLVRDMFHDRWSQFTWLLYLNDDFDGGATRFFVHEDEDAAVPEVRPKRGAALCFFHGQHPLSPVHEGGLVTRGTKYVVRSDVLYMLPTRRGKSGSDPAHRPGKL